MGTRAKTRAATGPTQAHSTDYWAAVHARKKARKLGLPLPPTPKELGLDQRSAMNKRETYYLEQITKDGKLRLMASNPTVRDGKKRAGSILERVCMECQDSAPASGFAPAFMNEIVHSGRGRPETKHDEDEGGSFIYALVLLCWDCWEYWAATIDTREEEHEAWQHLQKTK